MQTRGSGQMLCCVDPDVTSFLGRLTSRIAPRDARRAIIFAPSRPRAAPLGKRHPLWPRPRRAKRGYLRAPGGDLAFAWIPSPLKWPQEV